jgi:hypothetical protein
MIDTFHVDAVHAVEILRGSVVGTAYMRNAGAVDEYVDAVHRFHDRIDLRLVRHITYMPDGLPTGGKDLLQGSVDIAWVKVCNMNGRTLTCETLRDGLTYAAAAACDEYLLALE